MFNVDMFNSGSINQYECFLFLFISCTYWTERNEEYVAQ